MNKKSNQYNHQWLKKTDWHEADIQCHQGSVSIGGRTTTNLKFADDIDGVAGSEAELKELISNINQASTDYGMEISAPKTKVMTNNITGMNEDISINGDILETVQSFKYLGAILSDKGSKPEILSRSAQTIAAMTKLMSIWNDKNISVSSKNKLMRPLAISIYLYACETWTVTAELEKRITAFEMICYWKILGITYKDRVTNKEVRNKIELLLGHTMTCSLL